MIKDRRKVTDKLNTLLFGKDLRITKGDVFSAIYEYDYSSYYPEDKYVYSQDLPKDNVFDIRDYGANTKFEDNAVYIQMAVDDAARTGGTV